MEKPDVILTGDLHLHDKPYSTSLQRSEKLLNDLRHLSRHANNCPIILNGDIFHKPNPSYSVLMLFKHFLESHEGLIVINVGNHDTFSVKGPDMTYLNLFKGYKNAHVVNDKPYIWPGKEVEVLVVPWRPADQFKKQLATLAGQKPHIPQMLVAHQPITEGQVNAEGLSVNQDLSYKDLFPDRFIQIFLSDYHEYQQIRKNIHYIGAPIQTKHGEKDQRGPVGIYGTGWRHLELPSVYREFKTYDVEEDVYIPDYDKEDYNRIRCPIHLKSELQLLYPGASIIPRSIVKRDIVGTSRASGDKASDALSSFLKSEIPGYYSTKRDRQIARKLAKHYYQKAREIMVEETK